VHKLLPLSAPYYHYTTGELYARRKKNEIQGEQQNKKKKNPFLSLPSYLPFFAYVCVCVCMFYQYINLQLVLHHLHWLRN
jgi:hypothetical protein